MSKHTKGPWKIIDGIVVKEWNNTNVVLARPCYPLWHENKLKGQEEQMSNARLIAAAPELLAICKNILSAHRDEIECGGRVYTDEKELAIIIAQVEGE